MQETRVYRVQDQDGRGPWKPGFSDNWVIDRPDHANLMPFFVEFPHVSFKIECGSGCLDLIQLKRWFTQQEYTTLLRHGYRAVQMNVDEILAESAVQVLFRRTRPFCQAVDFVELYPDLLKG